MQILLYGLSILLFTIGLLYALANWYLFYHNYILKKKYSALRQIRRALDEQIEMQLLEECIWAMSCCFSKDRLGSRAS